MNDYIHLPTSSSSSDTFALELSNSPVIPGFIRIGRDWEVVDWVDRLEADRVDRFEVDPFGVVDLVSWIA